MKKNKGITLIALVITIIVLLILAGVTIATLTGDNGLLQKATSAKEENEQAKELELIKLAVSAAQVAGEGKLTTGNLNTELQSNFNDIYTSVTEIHDGWSYKSYKIETNGNVYNLLPKEYIHLEYIESTKTQWINTNIKNDVLDYKFLFNCNFLFEYSDLAKTIIGDGGPNGFSLLIGGSGIGYYDIIYNGYEIYNASNKLKRNIKSFNEVTIAPEVQSWTADNAIILHSNKGEILQKNKILIFRGNHSVDYGAPIKARLYDMKIFKYSNNEIIRDYIPCKALTTVTNADGNPVPADTKGLYDLVEGKFYTNANTSANAVDFIAGPEV